jgi:hypothetical protein
VAILLLLIVRCRMNIPLHSALSSQDIVPLCLLPNLDDIRVTIDPVAPVQVGLARGPLVTLPAFVKLYKSGRSAVLPPLRSLSRRWPPMGPKSPLNSKRGTSSSPIPIDSGVGGRLGALTSETRGDIGRLGLNNKLRRARISRPVHFRPSLMIGNTKLLLLGGPSWSSSSGPASL